MNWTILGVIAAWLFPLGSLALWISRLPSRTEFDEHKLSAENAMASAAGRELLEKVRNIEVRIADVDRDLRSTVEAESHRRHQLREEYEEFRKLVNERALAYADRFAKLEARKR